MKLSWVNRGISLSVYLIFHSCCLTHDWAPICDLGFRAGSHLKIVRKLLKHWPTLLHWCGHRKPLTKQKSQSCVLQVWVTTTSPLIWSVCSRTLGDEDPASFDAVIGRAIMVDEAGAKGRKTESTRGVRRNVWKKTQWMLWRRNHGRTYCTPTWV